MHAYTPGSEDTEAIAALRRCADNGGLKTSAHDYPTPLSAKFNSMEEAQKALGSLFSQFDALYREREQLIHEMGQLRNRARDALEEVVSVAMTAEKKYRIQS